MHSGSYFSPSFFFLIVSRWRCNKDTVSAQQRNDDPPPPHPPPTPISLLFLLFPLHSRLITRSRYFLPDILPAVVAPSPANSDCFIHSSVCLFIHPSSFTVHYYHYQYCCLEYCYLFPRFVYLESLFPMFIVRRYKKYKTLAASSLLQQQLFHVHLYLYIHDVVTVYQYQ